VKEVIINGVCRIANILYKKKFPDAIPITREITEAVLKAEDLLENEIKNGSSPEKL